MRTTHAKSANPFDSNTIDLGLKHDCQCGSGKKFKHCCYSVPQVGWGWVAMFEEGMSLVPTWADQIPGIGDGFKGVPFVLVVGTYKEGTEWLNDNGVTKQTKVLLIRLAIEDLLIHIQGQFERGQRVIVVVPPEVSEDGDGTMHDINVP